MSRLPILETLGIAVAVAGFHSLFAGRVSSHFLLGAGVVLALVSLLVRTRGVLTDSNAVWKRQAWCAGLVATVVVATSFFGTVPAPRRSVALGAMVHGHTPLVFAGSIPSTIQTFQPNELSESTGVGAAVVSAESTGTDTTHADPEPVEVIPPEDSESPDVTSAELETVDVPPVEPVPVDAAPVTGDVDAPAPGLPSPPSQLRIATIQ